MYEQSKKNAGGSYDVYFGPKPPVGHENNWVQTVPGKSWWVVLRRYGALEPWYRVGSGLRATEDLAAAISYVFKNADRLEVSVTGYSLWGGSAGARMVGNIALHGTAGFGGDDLPKPISSSSPIPERRWNGQFKGATETNGL